MSEKFEKLRFRVAKPEEQNIFPIWILYAVCSVPFGVPGCPYTTPTAFIRTWKQFLLQPCRWAWKALEKS